MQSGLSQRGPARGQSCGNATNEMAKLQYLLAHEAKLRKPAGAEGDGLRHLVDANSEEKRKLLLSLLQNKQQTQVDHTPTHSSRLPQWRMLPSLILLTLLVLYIYYYMPYTFMTIRAEQPLVQTSRLLHFWQFRTARDCVGAHPSCEVPAATPLLTKDMSTPLASWLTSL